MKVKHLWKFKEVLFQYLISKMRFASLTWPSNENSPYFWAEITCSLIFYHWKKFASYALLYTRADIDWLTEYLKMYRKNIVVLSTDHMKYLSTWRYFFLKHENLLSFFLYLLFFSIPFYQPFQSLTFSKLNLFFCMKKSGTEVCVPK